MSFVYTKAKVALATGALDLSSAIIWAMLVMTNTTADTEEDLEFVGDLTTLDECDGALYARQPVTPGQAVNEDTVNNRAEFDADNIEFEDVGVGTRQNQALVLYIDADFDGDPADDATNALIAYIDSGGFPFDGNGSDIILNWNAEGILQVA